MKSKIQIALPRIIAFGILANAEPVALRSGAADAAVPEVARLANAFVGEWNTVEVVQYGKAVPEGAGHHGTVHVALTGGGTALVSEGHSVGTVGRDLRWFITIWWDPAAKCYRFLTCFKTPADAGCELRGTAHWEGDTFVNDYAEVMNGKLTKMRDT